MVLTVPFLALTLVFFAVFILEFFFFFFQAEDGIRDGRVTGVQTCALPILVHGHQRVSFHPRQGEPDAGLFRGHAERAAAAGARQTGHSPQSSLCPAGDWRIRSEERRVGKECRSRWSTYQ